MNLCIFDNKIAVKIKRSLQGSPVENTHKMLRIWMGKKRSGGVVGGIPFYRVGILFVLYHKMPVRTAGAEPSTSRAEHPGRAGLQLDGLAAKQEKALFVRRKC